jgi:hypothetical protein
MGKLNKISLLCISLIFFYFYIFEAASTITNPAQRLVNLVPLISTWVGLVSFLGSLLWIVEIKSESAVWYYAIPNSVALFVLIVSNFTNGEGGGYAIDYFAIISGILAITSMVFFLSFPAPQKKFTCWFALGSGIIGMYAVITIYTIAHSLLNPLQTSWSVVTGLEALYWLIFMPLIGLMYVAAAFVDR